MAEIIDLQVVQMLNALKEWSAKSPDELIEMMLKPLTEEETKLLQELFGE